MVSVPQPSKAQPWLVGDIGGTNARFGLIVERGAPPTRVQVLPCGDHADVIGLLAAYVHALPARPSVGCFGVAGPVRHGRSRLTNRGFDICSDEIATAFCLDSVTLLNDFAALSRSLPVLGSAALRPIGGGAASAGTMAVLGPGTGLGVAACAAGADGRPVVISGEGGHMALPARDEFEIDVLRVAGRDVAGPVTAETVLSGPGLKRLYVAVGEVLGLPGQDLESEQISRAALAGSDFLSRQTLQLFCAFLGETARTVALTFGALGGVYLGGGILPGLAGYLQDSQFRYRFEGAGLMHGYLAQIPTLLIDTPYASLVGAAAHLEDSVR